MFRLIRFFLHTSAAAATAIALIIYRQNEVQRLIDFAEQQNVELAQVGIHPAGKKCHPENPG